MSDVVFIFACGLPSIDFPNLNSAEVGESMTTTTKPLEEQVAPIEKLCGNQLVKQPRKKADNERSSDMASRKETHCTYACCAYESPFGTITLAAGDDGLKGLWFNGQRYFAGTLDAPMEPRDNAHLSAARSWLNEYFAGDNPDITRLTLAPIGGEFRQVVWQLLREIPLGQVRTYGEIALETARRMGKKRGSARAVGGAVGHNPISIIVPCHRIVGANGNLTGFGGGITRKLQLLKHEGVDCSGFYVPKHSTAP